MSIEHHDQRLVKSSALVSDRLFCHSRVMATHRTARERAREEITREIVDEARRQLAEQGAASLSLRSVARELGMVSSAVYRYVASRDELLTRLIVEAYDSLGDATERAVAASSGDTPLDRWVAAALVVRAWALEHPHEYGLLYGAPVPGYAAPDDTVVPGTRVSRALISIVHDARATGQLPRRARRGEPLPETLSDDFAGLRSELDLDLDDVATLDVLLAWTQLFGLLGFELFGQTRGLVADDRALFETAARRMGGHLGLR
jgi:AcrR family transcriptional regulator